MTTYMSDRGLPLVYTGDPDPRPGAAPVLTVENYLKWYTLYAVHPDGRVEAVDMLDAGLGFANGWRDHVPHPAACVRYAALKGWDWHDPSLDMVYGRFAREVREVTWGEEGF